jgi:hypothetical protein
MMDNTAATFTGGIVVAALGGLTFIAYNHHNSGFCRWLELESKQSMGRHRSLSGSL